MLISEFKKNNFFYLFDFLKENWWSLTVFASIFGTFHQVLNLYLISPTLINFFSVNILLKDGFIILTFTFLFGYLPFIIGRGFGNISGDISNKFYFTSLYSLILSFLFYFLFIFIHIRIIGLSLFLLFFHMIFVIYIGYAFSKYLKSLIYLCSPTYVNSLDIVEKNTFIQKIKGFTKPPFFKGLFLLLSIISLLISFICYNFILNQEFFSIKNTFNFKRIEIKFKENNLKIVKFYLSDQYLFIKVDQIKKNRIKQKNTEEIIIEKADILFDK